MNILTVFALLLVPASPAPASPAPTSPAPGATIPAQSAAVTPAAVIVRLGEASLEEYRHGDPAGRIQLLRRS